MRIVIPMTTTNPLNRLVTEALSKAGLTHRDAATALDVHPTTAERRIESRPLTARDLRILAILLGTTASALQRQAEGTR